MISQAHDEAMRTLSERLRESGRFHMGVGKVHETLRTLASELTEAGIPYAVIGGMALNAHGYRRQTTNVDVLVRPKGLALFLGRLLDQRYLATVRSAPNTFMNSSTGVEVKLLITGTFPGDGKPKPVSFPDPVAAAVEIDGVQYVGLPTLIELKLAAGMTQPGRLRHLADVQELIRVLDLGETFAERLNPYVRPSFLTLLEGVKAGDALEEHEGMVSCSERTS